MKQRTRWIVMGILMIGLGSVLQMHAQSATAATSNQGAAMQHATGTFEVKIAPAEASALGKEAGMGRMTIDKSFSGALEGTSRGEMLTGMTESTGAMAYVAIEKVTGKLEGKTGSFLLMHNASMLKSNPQAGVMSVSVVPDSGTGELAGLSGKMSIVIDKSGKHSYEFEYTLAH